MGRRFLCFVMMSADQSKIIIIHNNLRAILFF